MYFYNRYELFHLVHVKGVHSHINIINKLIEIPIIIRTIQLVRVNSSRSTVDSIRDRSKKRIDFLGKEKMEKERVGI